MRNATFNFLSTLLALGAIPATYKPAPFGPAMYPETLAEDLTGTGNLLLMGPHNITYFPKVAEMSDPVCHVEPYNAPPVGLQEFPPYDKKIADIFRYRQQRSVNLGSWSAL